MMGGWINLFFLLLHRPEYFTSDRNFLVYSLNHQESRGQNKIYNAHGAFSEIVKDHSTHKFTTGVVHKSHGEFLVEVQLQLKPVSIFYILYFWCLFDF